MLKSRHGTILLPGLFVGLWWLYPRADGTCHAYCLKAEYSQRLIFLNQKFQPVHLCKSEPRGWELAEISFAPKFPIPALRIFELANWHIT